MNERRNERKEEGRSEDTKGRRDEWTKGRRNEGTNGRMDEWTNGRMDEGTNGRRDEGTTKGRRRDDEGTAKGRRRNDEGTKRRSDEATNEHQRDDFAFSSQEVTSSPHHTQPSRVWPNFSTFGILQTCKTTYAVKVTCSHFYLCTRYFYLQHKLCMRAG